MTVYQNVLEMVGNTPLLEVHNLDTGPCRLFLKMELANRVSDVLFSPSHGVLSGRDLAEWILADNLPVRLQLQLHLALL